MIRYILWRIAVMIPTLLIISALIFTIIELPALLVLGTWFFLQLLPAFSEPVGSVGARCWHCRWRA